jgi:poly-gamma-glutamate capsule biosynthesis protein CapA/YwtB (metallophosphatase superfamily)
MSKPGTRRPGTGRRRLRYLGAAVGSAALLAVPACSGGLHFGQPAATKVASAGDTSPAGTATRATPAGSPAGRPASGLAAMLANSLAGTLTNRTAGMPAASPAAAGSSGAAVTLTAVGDTMLGSLPDLPPDPAAYLDPVEPVLRHGGQVVFANLEGTLTTASSGKCGSGSAPHPNCFAFRDPPSYAHYLKAAGFTVLNDANNHSFDFGAAGQAQTVRSIHAAGLAQTGLPGEITRVRAGGTTVALVAFAPYPYTANLLGLPAARALIQRARSEAKLVVVYMHAGAEGATADHVTGREEIYLGEDRGNPEAFAHMAIDAGASLVIASGPHVVRGLQFYKGHLIAYSLGNFAGYGNFSVHGTMTMSAILRVKLSASGRFEQGRLYSLALSSQGRPSLGGGAAAFMGQLSAADFGHTAARISSTGAISAPR